MAIISAITSTLAVIGTAIGGAMAIAPSVVATIGTIYKIARIAISLYFIGSAILGGKNKYNEGSPSYNSPTYSFGPLQTQCSNLAVRPLIYGQVKVAGNKIWQTEGNTQQIDMIVCLGDGEVDDILEVKFNDTLVEELPGCSYTVYYGNGTQNIDSRIPGATQADKAAVVGGLKYDAYLAITASASEKLSGQPNVTALVKGRKVRVYTAIDTYTTIYSNNPVWCILDFLTCYNGCGIVYTDIDIATFITAAAICNATVSGQPRYTLNLVLDARQSRIDWLNDMLLCAQAYIIYYNGKIGINIERADSYKQLFNTDNIINATLNFTPREQRYDIVKVQYIDPDNEYARVYAVAEASEFKNEQPIVREVPLYGCSSFKQASRLAWFYLNQTTTTNKIITFLTHKAGLDRYIGDVIRIDGFFGFANKDFRILRMDENASGTIEITTIEYNANLYTDTQGSVAPVIDVILLQGKYSQPGDVPLLSAKIILISLFLEWDSTTTPGLKYEIREGESWDDSILIATNLVGNTYYCNIYGTGEKNFHIKAFNQYGKYSLVAASDSIVIPDTYLRNIVITTQLFNTDNLVPDIKSGEYWQNLEGQTWQASGTRYYADVNNRWTYLCVSSFYFESAEIDIGGDLDSLWYINYDFYKGGDDLNTIKFLWKYKISSGSYQGTWLEFSPGTYTARYAKFRIEFSNPNNILSSLKYCEVTADVPDRREFYNDINISASGTIITFASHPQSKILKSFTTTPTVVITPEDNSKNLSPVYSGRTKDSVTIYLYDKNDTKVSGTVDVSVVGY